MITYKLLLCEVGEVMRCLSCCLMAMIKSPDKSILKDKGFLLAHSSRLQYVMEKSQRRELNEAGLIASAVTRQRDSNACLLEHTLFSPFDTVQCTLTRD